MIYFSTALLAYRAVDTQNDSSYRTRPLIDTSLYLTDKTGRPSLRVKQCDDIDEVRRGLACEEKWREFRVDARCYLVRQVGEGRHNYISAIGLGLGIEKYSEHNDKVPYSNESVYRSAFAVFVRHSDG